MEKKGEQMMAGLCYETRTFGHLAADRAPLHETELE